jgi:ABC-type multidrug transport system fused ATPase/permease subunit
LADKEPKRKVKLSTAWGYAREIIWSHRRRVGIGLGLLLINRAAGFVLPASTKFLIDNVLTEGRMDLLIWLALAAVTATLVQSVTTFTLSQLLSVAAQRSITEMRKRVARHVIRLPTQQFDRTKSGVLVSRIMNDAEGIRNLVGTGLVQMIGGILTASVALAVLFYLNWQMTSVTLVILIGFGAVMAVAFGRLRPLFRKRGEIIADVTGRLTETLGGIRTVRAYTAEKREELVFAKGAHRLLRNIAASITGVSGTTAAATFMFGMVAAVMMYMGGRAVIGGQMTLGDLFMYVVFIGLVAQPMVQMASIGTQITDAFAGLDRIREIMGVATEDDEDASKAELTDIQGDIEFDGVWFEYEPGAPVLRGVSFRADAGTTTALVGSSGSGKSTLISLVMAFNHPKAGAIRIDGRDLSALKLRSYRSHLGVVLQDNFLFDGTIAENIRFSRPGATMEEVVEVSRIAHCDEFIETFEEGYDTIVGERGVKLSGGQRQRVAIARAILANPRILILDEATSSLDSESEAMIQDGLNTLRRGRTTFVIAHRLSTIQAADQILVLEHGEIVERGNHSELLAKEGRYRELYDKQYHFERNRFINPGEEFEAEEAATP